MPTADWIIYLKKSLRSFWNNPKPKNLFSLIQYYPDWREHLQPGRSPLEDQTPWMGFAAISFLKKIVRGDMHVFEFGSGGSTMFWAPRVREIISVEHDPSWFALMKKHLDQHEIQNVVYILAEPSPDKQFPTKNYENPDDFISSDPAYAGKKFEQYVKSIDGFPDGSFDIIVVDGRARPSCIQHGIPKLKKNGWLIIDNTERKYYAAPFNFDRNSWVISKFAGPVPYMRDFSETTFLKKLI